MGNGFTLPVGVSPSPLAVAKSLPAIKAAFGVYHAPLWALKNTLRPKMAYSVFSNWCSFDCMPKMRSVLFLTRTSSRILAFVA
jgi:hypothetical protein